MSKCSVLHLILGVTLLLLLPASAQTNANTAAAPSSSPAQPTDSAGLGFNVCQGVFANCTEAACDPVSSGGKITGFKCKCAVQKGYSLGLNGPGNRNSCQSIPKDGPSVKQKVPSRYAPITTFVVCTNKRPWAACLDAPCIVDHVDANDPAKGTAVCACPKTTGSPYGFTPKDGKFSRTGCQDEYVSSATATQLLTITQYLTTPAGKDLPALPITVLVPTPTPTPSH